MFSALPPNSDIARCIRHVSKVPRIDFTRSAQIGLVTRWTPACPTYWSSGRRIALREFSTTFGYGSPLLFTVAIDVHFRIKPTRVIKRSSVYKGETGNTGSVKDGWRSAFRTET